jgi:hypothetical protein
VCYWDSESVPTTFLLREGQNVDVGFLKLFLSREHVDLSEVAQSSPFDFIGARYTTARYTTEAKLKVPINLPVRHSGTLLDKFKHRLPVRHLWDTILVPVVQRRADK